VYNKIVIAALTLLALGATVRVEGSATCPQPDAIASRLAPLLQSNGNDSHVARVDDTSAGLRLELHRADGSLVQSRVLPPSESCDALADTAAVVIAAWESDLAAHEPPAPRFAAPEPRHDAPPPTAADPTPQWTIGAAFLTSFADGDLAPGGMAELAYLPAHGSLGARIAVSGTTTRQVTLGTGTASWTHVAFAIGPRYAVPSKHAPIDLHAEFIGSALLLSGAGFRMSSSDTGFDAGFGAGIRLAGSRHTLSPWLDFGAAFWPSEQTVRASNPDVSATLPRVEILFAAGIDFGL
jgi:hypothetical protein